MRALPGRRQALLLLTCGMTGGWSRVLAATPAPVMLAYSYQRGVRLADYGVSEKYDGIRGYWDGQRLWTRGGEAIAAPAWFTADWPAQAMDGELWAGRGNFSKAVSIVRQQVPQEQAWRDIKFMVFDLPAHAGPFSARNAELHQRVPALNKPWLVAVLQQEVADHESLQALMDSTVRQGGEGLVLHRLDSAYRAGRSRDLLKFKPADDADARVIAIVPGRGRHQGKMGALLLETAEGLRFKLGTGFDDATRRNPPAVGSWISFRFRGETDNGVPRFASFLRVRTDLPS